MSVCDANLCKSHVEGAQLLIQAIPVQQHTNPRRPLGRHQFHAELRGLKQFKASLPPSAGTSGLQFLCQTARVCQSRLHTSSPGHQCMTKAMPSQVQIHHSDGGVLWSTFAP